MHTKHAEQDTEPAARVVADTDLYCPKEGDEVRLTYDVNPGINHAFSTGVVADVDGSTFTLETHNFRYGNGNVDLASNSMWLLKHARSGFSSNTYDCTVTAIDLVEDL